MYQPGTYMYGKIHIYLIMGFMAESGLLILPKAFTHFNTLRNYTPTFRIYHCYYTFSNFKWKCNHLWWADELKSNSQEKHDNLESVFIGGGDKIDESELSPIQYYWYLVLVSISGFCMHCEGFLCRNSLKQKVRHLYKMLQWREKNDRNYIFFRV